MNTQLFAPGCALYIYKPHLAEKLLSYLNELNETQMYMTCCKHEPPKSLLTPAHIINVCSGCDKRYSSLYDGITTETLWQLLSRVDFPFPDYNGAEVTVHDACPTRHKPDVHNAVRTLLEKMNFKVIEAPKSGIDSFCCGDSLYGRVPKEEVLEKMKKRANSMPVSDVVVYCISCIKSLSNGGRNPRYMVDLLFNEETVPGECDPDLWHESLNKFVEKH